MVKKQKRKKNADTFPPPIYHIFFQISNLSKALEVSR